MFNGGSKNNPAISCSKKNRIMNSLKVDNVNNADLPEFIYCYIITGQAGFKETEIQPKKKKKKRNSAKQKRKFHDKTLTESNYAEA